MKVEFDANKYDSGIEEIGEEELLKTIQLEQNKFRILNKILNQEGDCAKLLELFYLEDLSWKKIGAKFNVIDSKGIATIRKKKERCLKKIRKEMEENINL